MIQPKLSLKIIKADMDCLGDLLYLDRINGGPPIGVDSLISFLHSAECGIYITYMEFSANLDIPVGFCIFNVRANSIGIWGITVDPCYRRIGIGTAMFNKIKEMMVNNINVISAVLRKSEYSIRHFIVNSGFNLVRTETVNEWVYEHFVFHKQSVVSSR